MRLAARPPPLALRRLLLHPPPRVRVLAMRAASSDPATPHKSVGAFTDERLDLAGPRAAP